MLREGDWSHVGYLIVKHDIIVVINNKHDSVYYCIRERISYSKYFLPLMVKHDIIVVINNKHDGIPPKMHFYSSM